MVGWLPSQLALERPLLVPDPSLFHHTVKAALFLDHKVSQIKVSLSLSLSPWLTSLSPHPLQVQPLHMGTHSRLSCWPLGDPAGHQCTGRLEKELPPPVQGCH
jgi:hypothetical protein